MEPYLPRLLVAAHWLRRLLLTLLAALSSSLLAAASHANPSIIPDDIAFRPNSQTPPPVANDIRVGTAEIPAPATQDALTTPSVPTTPNTTTPNTTTPNTTTPNTTMRASQTTQYLGDNLCPDHSGSHFDLQKSLVVTRFLRSAPHTANAGNLFAAEHGVPALIRAQLSDKFRSVSPSVLAFGFATPLLTDTQLKQQAQKIARQARTQFVLGGTLEDMAMAYPDTTYNPNLYRQAANVFHDITRLKTFDRRTRVMSLSVQLRDGFTGELLFNKHYSTSGIWNTRTPVGFDSPAFYKTHYGKRVTALTQKISRDIAQVIHCQPFMASIDSQPGQTHILLHGGANNGLHAGDTLSLYQLVMVGSNTDYQVNETRLVKRNTRLHLSEVYPSHSIALVEGGNYLNGHYLAVGE